MQINVSTRHGQLSEAAQNKIKAKAEKLNRFFDRLTSIALTVDVKDPENPAVDIQVSAEHKHDFVAHEKGTELMAAVDAAIQKMEQQIRKYKERVQSRHRKTDVRRQLTEVDTPADAEAELDASE